MAEDDDASLPHLFPTAVAAERIRGSDSFVIKTHS